MEQQLAHLIYVSNASDMMTHEAVRELVDESKKRNREIDVTGVLLYGNQHFMQLLEGDLHVVNALYQKVARDHRHHHVTRIAFYPVPSRQFADWSMNLINLEDHKRVDYKRLEQILREQTSASSQDADHYSRLSKELLEEFRKQLMPELPAVGDEPCVLSAEVGEPTP
jgi:hypothetical protein